MSISDALMLEYFDRWRPGSGRSCIDARESLREGQGDPWRSSRASPHGWSSASTARPPTWGGSHFARNTVPRGAPDDIPGTRPRGRDVEGERGARPARSASPRRAGAAPTARPGAWWPRAPCRSTARGSRTRPLRLRVGGPYLLKVGKRRFARCAGDLRAGNRLPPTGRIDRSHRQRTVGLAFRRSHTLP